MLAALLGAVYLFSAAPAQAQTTVWSATLTVKTIDVGVGCLNAAGVECSTLLTDDDFTQNSVDYEIDRIRLLANNFGGQLSLSLNKNVPSSFSDYTLRVDGSDFAVTSVSGKLIIANNTGLSWSVGDTVSVSLSTPPPPTVTLSVSPNPVVENSSTEVTLTLSRTLSSDVTIPVTVTAGSAESGDYVSGVSSTIISAGNVESLAGSIFANDDTDEDDETLTVALGTLPSPLVAGTQSSVTLTIRDDDGLRLSVKPSHPTPACGTAVTDTCVRPGLALMLTPAPAELTETEFRAIPRGEWKGAVPIRTDGHAGSASNVTFARLRELFPGFMGYEYRLKDTPGVTARCTWTSFKDQDSESCHDHEPPSTNTPVPPTGGVPPTSGGGPSPGGGGSPPAEPSDPTPDSPRCGESDREDLESFYEATGGDAWDRNEHWNSQEPLDEWFGVGTDENGEVVSLRLANNNLSEDMPTKELLCLNENTELKELALWDNEDLSGEVPEELLLAVERAALRAIAEMLDINPEWFENYEDPFNFEDWHSGVTTDENGRVTELDLPGEIPESIRFQFKKLRREIMTTTSSGGCAVGASQGRTGASGLLAAVFIMLLAVSRGFRARSY